MKAILSHEKRELRRELRARVKGISPEERRAASAQACALIRNSTLWQTARLVLLYAPMKDEIDVWPLVCEGIVEGKTVGLPRYMAESRDYAAFQVCDAAKDCAPGNYGIIEPIARCESIALNHLDLVIVPGVGFDTSGGRLGHGRGYYDRLLAQVRGVKCGIAFDQQMTERVPMEEHDTRLDCILTPSGWVSVRVNT